MFFGFWRAQTFFFIKLGQAVRCQIAAQTTATHDDLMIKVGHFGCCPKQCISNYIRDSAVLVFVKGPPRAHCGPRHLCHMRACRIAIQTETFEHLPTSVFFFYVSIAAQTTTPHDYQSWACWILPQTMHFEFYPRLICACVRERPPREPTSPLSHEGMLLAAALLSKPRLSNICRPTFLFLCQHRRPDPNTTCWIKLGHVGFGQMMSETRLCVFLWEGPNHMVIKLGSCGARCFILWSQIFEERAAQPTCPNQRTVTDVSKGSDGAPRFSEHAAVLAARVWAR